MKKTLKNLIGFLFIAITILSCKKEENKDYLLNGAAPVLTASFNAANLAFANADNLALNLTWTNPNYQFTTGVSSQDVSYLIEIDTTGSNFTNPQRQSIAVSKDLGQAFTGSQLNNYLLNELLAPGIPHNLEIRLKASLSNSAATLISNVVKLTATPYSIPPKVALPTTGQLFLVGNATPGGDATGWNNPVPVPSQQFTQISPTLYQIIIPLIGGKEYLILPLNGDWGHKYAVPDKTAAGLSSGGDFGFDKSDNFPGPSASGTYKIQVNFQTGKFSVTQQ
jgi:starch-binding outer membrane protein SusE/F